MCLKICFFYKYIYTLHHQKNKNKKLDVCQAPRYVKVPGINKIKNINYRNKNKSKKLYWSQYWQMKIKIYPLLRKTNNQTRQIICLFMVSRYNFHYLKRLFIKSFSWWDKINCSTKNPGVITWAKWRISKKQSLCQNFTGIH